MRTNYYLTLGCGKSFILRVLQDVLASVKMSDKVAFTAPTGVAACNISGMTIHAWAGVGRGTDPLPRIIAGVNKNNTMRNRWIDTEILVIDEISMLSAELFDIISAVGSSIRGDPRPFGGIQLIICGDFYQLPPIGLGKNAHYCFESLIWKQLFTNNMVVLDKVFRQKDSYFLNILNDLRIGIVTDNVAEFLLQKVLESKNCEETDVVPTKLFATNANVDNYNWKELEKLPLDDEHYFKAVDSGEANYLNQLRAGTKAPEELVLRVGAQVMLLKNISTSVGLVNGTRGVVVGFDKSNGRSSRFPYIPIVKFYVSVGSKKGEEVVHITEDTWDIRKGEK